MIKIKDVIYVLIFISLIITGGCSNCKLMFKYETKELNVAAIKAKIESIDSTINVINLKTISADDMEELIKTTPFWKSLELEELSDKNRVPINQLKNDYEKD